MKIPLEDANRCLKLIEALDLFTLETANIFKKGETIVVSSMAEVAHKLRFHWQGNAKIIDDFIAASNEQSLSDKQLLDSWKSCKRKKYLVVKYYDDYGVFISMDDKTYYGVLALTQDFKDVLPIKPPTVIETCLLPYNGRIIWDGMGGTFSLSIGSKMRSVLDKECIQKRKNGGIMLQL